MRLFELLKQEQKPAHVSASDEYAFFMSNRHLLVDCSCFLDLYNLEDSFAMVKANIVLKSIQNKMAIDAKLEKLGKQSIVKDGRIHHHNIRIEMLKEEMELPYFIDQDIKMYVPIFNRAMNYIYAKEPDKLYDFPYEKLFKDFSGSTINPFETYNFSLFDSNFTKLIKLGSDDTSMAFYHLDYRELLIINRQGGLDVKIHLFDRHLKQPNYEGIIDRLLPVIDAFFNNDRE